jgi:TM2 domain-containing membrane protein YozV
MRQRTDNPDVIEHRLLDLVYTTDVPITPMALAYYAPCSLEDAEKVLDRLTARDRIQLEVADDGTMTYVFPNRHKLTPHERPQLSLTPLRPEVLAAPVVRDRPASPFVAAGLSLLIPGAGQLYAGSVLSAILWFLLVSAGYTLIVPGLILHMFCIATAAGAARRLNYAMARLQIEAG